MIGDRYLNNFSDYLLYLIKRESHERPELKTEDIVRTRVADPVILTGSGSNLSGQTGSGSNLSGQTGSGSMHFLKAGS